MSRLSQILDTLESFHGPQTAHWPTDPYQFLVWWHCGYPASEERCSRGWDSVNEEIGVSAEMLLKAPSSKLARALKAGGMIAELRAGRLKQIAQTVRERFDGDLSSALKRLPLTEARGLLKTFPGIAEPGADRIILFGGIATVAAVPSGYPHVLVRIESGTPHKTYTRNYRDAQQTMQSQLGDTFAARTRAYLLVQQHGLKLCKRVNPKCSICPIAKFCTFALSTGTIAPTS